MMADPKNDKDKDGKKFTAGAGSGVGRMQKARAQRAKSSKGK
jgi:hypothetical protein